MSDGVPALAQLDSCGNSRLPAHPRHLGLRTLKALAEKAGCRFNGHVMPDSFTGH
jgi:hypothetical protein